MAKLSIQQFADKHDVSRQRVYARIKAGSLPCTIENGHIWIDSKVAWVKMTAGRRVHGFTQEVVL